MRLDRLCVQWAADCRPHVETRRRRPSHAARLTRPRRSCRLCVAEIASEMLKGRVFELNLADLNRDEDQAYRKMYLQCEEV